MEYEAGLGITILDGAHTCTSEDFNLDLNKAPDRYLTAPKDWGISEKQMIEMLHAAEIKPVMKGFLCQEGGEDMPGKLVNKLGILHQSEAITGNPALACTLTLNQVTQNIVRASTANILRISRIRTRR